MQNQRMRLVLVSVLLLLALNGAFNLALDASGLWPRLHIVLEILTTLVAMGAATVLWSAWRRAARADAAARRSLEERKAERDQWRASARKALEGLGQAMDQQFSAWGLTPTEREIALCLLKGYSHKRVADLTSRKERTVRQHSVVVYQKAGLSGRAELAAHFLDDLILPDAQREVVRMGSHATDGAPGVSGAVE
ncbi:MAG TPA: helix-turn-helix transcriptional regulator [Longimicrobiales bacterium]|nr:helix-turn-helix transcriptional regulator [Longimicrobiales bacterium]